MIASSHQIIINIKGGGKIKKYLRSACLLLLLISLFPLVAFGGEGLPQRKGMINDFANVIPPNVKADIEARVREVFEKTGITIAVATVQTMGVNYTSDYANRLYKAWGIGKKGENKGVLIFVAVKERKVRIETGYGVEGILPDGKVGEILRNEVLPHFKKNDYGTGLMNAVNAVSMIIAEDAKVKLSEQAITENATPPVADIPPEQDDGVDAWGIGIVLGIIAGLFALIFFLVKKFGGKGGGTSNNGTRLFSGSSGTSGSDSSDSGDSGFDGGESGGGGSESDY